jgi:transcription elongation GreA/GreB family factor
MTIQKPDRAALKKDLYRVVMERFDASIKELELNVRDLQSAANEETKSSVGDKYETGRAMAQLEIEKLYQQIQDKKKGRDLLHSLHADQLHEIIQLGSVVETTSGNFYICLNAGEVEHQEKKFITISLQSPLGKLLAGKAKGDEVTLNNRHMTITFVY